jgi:four helix bundle protein
LERSKEMAQSVIEQNIMEQKQYDIKDRTYHFSLDVISMVKKLSTDHVSRIISAQLLRSATSVGANIMEAQAGCSKKDFTNYMSIALKSANETRYWLSLLKDSKSSSEKSIDPLLEEIKQISNILGSSLITLKNKNQA